MEGPFIIKLDAEGAELAILKGGKQVLKNTEAIVLEVVLIPFSENTPRFDEVIDTLRDLGFLAYDIVDLQWRQYDDTLRKVDIIFVKKDNPIINDLRVWTPKEYEWYNRKYAGFNYERASGE